MLKELLESLQQTWQRGERFDVLEVNHGADIYIRRPDGTVDVRQVEAAPRNHRVESLTALLECAKLWVTGSGVVWHDDRRIQLVVDDDARLDVVALPLDTTAQWDLLSRMEQRGGQTFDQRQLLKFLRVDLAGTGAENYLTAFRNVVFKRSGQAGGEIQHGDESLGRSVEQNVSTGSAELPEVLSISVNRYTAPDLFFPQPFNLLVEVDLDNQRFTLHTTPNEFDRARHNTQTSIRDKARTMLAEMKVEGVSVVYGDCRIEPAKSSYAADYIGD